MQCKQTHELLALTFNISTNHISLYQNLDCFGIYVLFSKEHLSHTLLTESNYVPSSIPGPRLPSPSILLLHLLRVALLNFFYHLNENRNFWKFSLIQKYNLYHVLYFYRKNSSMIFITIHFNHESHYHHIIIINVHRNSWLIISKTQNIYVEVFEQRSNPCEVRIYIPYHVTQ